VALYSIMGIGVVSLPLVLWMSQAGSSAGPLDRYATYRKANPSLGLEFDYQMNSRKLTGARAFVDSGKQARLDVKGMNEDYSGVMTSAGFTEVERSSGTYDVRNLVDEPVLPASRIAGATQVFPKWINVPNLRQLAPPDATVQIKGKERGLGVECDVVTATFGSPEAKGDAPGGVVEAAVAPDGRLARLSMTNWAPMQPRLHQSWTFRKFEAAPADERRYTLAIPDGFVPYSLDGKYGPVGVGESMPTSGWTATAGGNFDLLGKLGAKGGLIALVTPGSVPSQRARASLAKLQGAGLPVVVVSDGTSPAAAAGADAFDSTGKLVEALRLPATPTFFLVDANGKITHLWMGYDATKATEFEKDVQEQFATR